MARPDARELVIRALARSGALSRADLARRSGLAASTVSAIVGELRADGLVVEPARAAHPPVRATVGRPPRLVSLHRRAGIAAGIDFGKRHVRLALCELSHTVLIERHRALDADLPGFESIAIAVEMLEEALDATAIDHSELVGVGMGLPGPIQGPSGELGDSTILPGWVGIRAADAVGSALGHPVEVENDANLGALAEWMWGAGRGIEHMAYVKAATGLGAGLIIDGRPYAGVGGSAGEIGHLVLDPDGPICRCGNRGCLEAVAGAPAICGALRDLHGGDLTLADVVARAHAGDFGCQRAIADAGLAIGTAVAALCNLFNPRRIVVGGPLSTAGDLLFDPLTRGLRQGAIQSAADDVEVVRSALGARAEVLGAVASVLRYGTHRL